MHKICTVQWIAGLHVIKGGREWGTALNAGKVAYLLLHASAIQVRVSGQLEFVKN